jgi:hypothetical protein
MTRTAVFALLIVPSVAAGAERWGPTWSEVTGNLWSRAQMNRAAVTVKQVDGKHETRRIVKVDPGRHEVVVASPMRKGFSGSDAKFAIDFVPCKRYYVNAQFKGGTGSDWEPVLAEVEDIAGCKVAKGGP